MKIIIYLTALLLSFSSITFSQSIIEFQAGTAIDVQAGASICADSVIINGTFTGGGTICGLLYSFNITMIIQGFYAPMTDIMVSDTVIVFIRNSSAPYSIVDSSDAVIDSSGSGEISFANVLNGVYYYIELKHRNSIETWSKTTQTFAGNSLTYNFTTAKTQAYGDNMINVDASPVRFAVYNGDVNQDGVIDLNDVLQTYNAANVFASGYVVTDINGDNITDLSDILIAYNNSTVFVAVVRP